MAHIKTVHLNEMTRQIINKKLIKIPYFYDIQGQVSTTKIYLDCNDLPFKTRFLRCQIPHFRPERSFFFTPFYHISITNKPNSLLFTLNKQILKIQIILFDLIQNNFIHANLKFSRFPITIFFDMYL
jgi:hypothetical protein